jgi:para-aminobenzoate synthetase/4-amino-4-deoxychorismate lyase
VVLELAGACFTPPVSCGLLAGVFRNWLLAHGQLRERILTSADLRTAQRVYLINSVRRWQEATLIT